MTTISPRIKGSQADIYIYYIAAQVKARRKRRKWSLARMARLCNWNKAFQIRVEAGEINFSLAMIERMCIVFRCSMEDLCKPIKRK